MKLLSARRRKVGVAGATRSRRTATGARMGGGGGTLVRLWRNVMSVSVGDLEGLVDTLLMLDTLMVGFLVAMLTQGSYSKDDVMKRDAFFMAVGVADMSHDPAKANATHAEIESHFIQQHGQVGVAFYFLSIACGVTTYVNLNLSRAREDGEAGRRFARAFVLVVLVGYILMILGLVNFYLCYARIIEVVFPLYCTPKLTLEKQEIEGGLIYDEYTNQMLEVDPAMWTGSKNVSGCHDVNFTALMVEALQRIIVVFFPVIIVSGFVINAYLDISQQRSFAPGVAEPLLIALDAAAPSFGDTYAPAFVAADISADQLPHLSFDHLVAVGVSVGDALRMMPAFATLTSSVEGTASRAVPADEATKPISASLGSQEPLKLIDASEGVQTNLTTV